MPDDASMPPPTWTRHKDSPMALAKKPTKSVWHHTSACPVSGSETSVAYMTLTDPKDLELLQSLPHTIHQSMAESDIVGPYLQSAGHIFVEYRGKSFEGTLAEDGFGNASHRLEIVAWLHIHVPGSDFSSRSWRNGQWCVTTARAPDSKEIQIFKELLNEDKRTLKMDHSVEWGYMSGRVSLGEMSLLDVEGTIIGSNKVEVSIAECDP